MLSSSFIHWWTLGCIWPIISVRYLVHQNRENPIHESPSLGSPFWNEGSASSPYEGVSHSILLLCMFCVVVSHGLGILVALSGLTPYFGSWNQGVRQNHYHYQLKYWNLYGYFLAVSAFQMLAWFCFAFETCRALLIMLTPLLSYFSYWVKVLNLKPRPWRTLINYVAISKIKCYIPLVAS